jgi:hypothetical protein
MIKNSYKYLYMLIFRFAYWVVKGISIDSLINKNSTEENYKHFKEDFKTSVLFRRAWDIRRYAIESAISNDPNGELFYLEFGVWKGSSSNFFSKYVKKFYAFDSFEGLREDWIGYFMEKGHFNLNKKIPKLNSNVEPVVGFVQDTLDDFLKENNPKINFVHLDMDTYPSTKYALERLKPYLIKDSVIIFDELYNYAGWAHGEYQALKEVFQDGEYIFKAFNTLGHQVVIQVK